jgi:putative DNA primase/helicase
MNTPASSIFIEETVTDAGNAGIFQRIQGQDVRYLHGQGQWLIWAGTHWNSDKNGEIFRRAFCVSERWLAQARSAFREALRLAKIGDEVGSAQAAAKGNTYRKNALQTQNIRKIKDFLEIAKAHPDIAITSRALNSNPWLINTKGCTVDLQTGDIYTPRREDLINRIAGCDYQPESPTPAFDAFLNSSVPDKDMQDFLQRIVGYTATGSNREQVFFVHFGAGGNGKSVFLEAIRAALGDYAQAAESSTFISEPNERSSSIPNDLARLDGVRSVFVPDVPQGGKWKDGIIKQITGGDTITARYLHKEFFDFEPVAKIHVRANHRPKAEDDDGFWRRARLIPWEVQPVQKDRALPEKLKNELPGILAWIVAGAIRWHAMGLEAPARVTEATSAYRSEQSGIKDWMDECCFVKDGLFTPLAYLHGNYEDWTKEEGIKYPFSKRKLADKLESLGFKRATGSGNVKGVLGIGVQQDVLGRGYCDMDPAGDGFHADDRFDSDDDTLRI